MEHAIVKGFVRYTNRNPASEVIVILEKLNEDQQGIYLNYTLTNRRGEFCFFIPDKTCTYCIKVFDNHHI
ncbi:hypothetical protein [Clostridium sp. E02]|uniref:hypothetical protein n=1 Tax=Clostridium sp. E02 TaxID=2487134 RepID=UPI000F5427A7|nr:hypothetical protein [Clostridium sp. E02]